MHYIHLSAPGTRAAEAFVDGVIAWKAEEVYGKCHG